MNSDKDWALPYTPFIVWFLSILWVIELSGAIAGLCLVISDKGLGGNALAAWICTFIDAGAFVAASIFLSRTKYANDEANWKQPEGTEPKVS